MAAAWAVLRAGHKVHFYANTDQPSVLYGCQYLHAPIPLPKKYSIRQTRVSYRMQGRAEDYRKKVYGSRWGGTVSPEDLEAEHDAWDIRATYGALWEQIVRHNRVSLSPSVIHHNWIATHTAELSRYSHVISTIPATALCAERHGFQSHTILAAGSTMAGDDSDEVVCDGTPDASWYRTACVFGYRTIEWPAGTLLPPTVHAVKVRKPLSSDCDCHPEIIRLGRYGAWRKGILVHQVFEDAEKIMSDSWVNQQW
jgi:hypothetical protein